MQRNIEKATLAISGTTKNFIENKGDRKAYLNQTLMELHY